MSVRRALRAGSELARGVRGGLGAVARAHRGYFDRDVRAQFEDSLDLDEALRAALPQRNRWDYLLNHEPSGHLVAVEPHSARQDEVTTIIGKRRAALDQLRHHLRPGVNIAGWLWVASGHVHFADTERARRRLDQAGIRFVGRAVGARHSPTPRKAGRTR